MKYPNQVQVALMLEQPVSDLENIVRTFMQVMEAQSGAQFNVSEANPGLYYRLFGAGELMVTFEHMPQPANMDVFRPALSSNYTGMLCQDIRERLIRSKAHILIEVSNGVMGGIDLPPSLAEIMGDEMGRYTGATQHQFQNRLQVAALAARIVNDTVPALAVHWTQSDQLFSGEMLDDLAGGGVPGPLNIHPFLFGEQGGPKGPAKIGIRTFGARHFIGGEVRIEPSILPWAANYEVICSFLNIATAENGYIIPHDDTFGPEGERISYRCLHHAAEEGDVPIYELIPLKHLDHDFISDDQHRLGDVIDDRAPPEKIMPQDQDAKAELANEWREKRAMAEGVGGRFQVRTRDDGYTGGPDGNPPPPPAPPTGGHPMRPRAVFGRKKAG